jgi:hypothetical protein
MEPARKRPVPDPTSQLTLESEAEKARRLEWETKVGKAIFYLTAATALWFFYWLNGIQCPC